MRSRTVRTEPHCPSPTLARYLKFPRITLIRADHTLEPTLADAFLLNLNFVSNNWALQNILCKGIKKELTMGQLQTTCLFPMTIYLWKIGQGWWLLWRWRRWWRGRSRWSSFETEAGLKKCKERQLKLKLQRPKLKWNDNGYTIHGLNYVSNRDSLFWVIEAFIRWGVQWCGNITKTGRQPEK